MKLLDNHYPRVKQALHGVQGFGVFVAWVITIAGFTRQGKSGGQVKYFFALCWFTIPILIYQTAVPIFTRTKRFSNVYAHAVIDILSTILWLAAFAAVAAWTNQGISRGKEKDGKKGCDIFAFGSPGKCKLGRGSVGCGVIICLLFALTSALSVYALLHFRRTGTLPGSTSPGAVPIADQTKYAFSSNPHDPDDFDEETHDLHNADDHNDTAYDPHMSGGRGGRDEDEYHSLHTDTEEGTHPGRPLSWGQQNQRPGPSELGQSEDTSYHGAGTYPQRQPSPYDPTQAPQDPFRNPSPYRNPSPLGAAGTYDHAPQLPPLGGAGDPFRDDLALSHDHGGYGRVNIPDASDYRPGR